MKARATGSGKGFVAEGDFGPALLLQHAGLQRGDVAGEDLTARGGDHIEIGARLAGAALHDAQEEVDAAALIGALDVGHFLLNGLLGLLGEQPLGHGRHIEDEESGAERKQKDVKRRQPHRRRAEHQPGPLERTREQGPATPRP
jgi:hypothetical protein